MFIGKLTLRVGHRGKITRKETLEIDTLIITGRPVEYQDQLRKILKHCTNKNIITAKEFILIDIPSEINVTYTRDGTILN